MAMKKGLTTILIIVSIGFADFDKSKAPEGRWYGEDTYFGYEYDMHANKDDENFGGAITVEYLVEMFNIVKPDLLQTDTKGHEGLVSWYSQTPAASIAPGIAKEMAKYWSQAADKLQIPIQAHYSGIWDMAAGEKFPDWCAVKPDGTPYPDKMCPLGPYADQLLVPQAKELIDRYGMDAIWVDGEIWAVVLCYCQRCKTEFHTRTGIDEPPVSQDDENWTLWTSFTRDVFQEYVASYTRQIHEHNPKIKVCSNWLHTLRNPGVPWVPTDYISGDNLGTLSQPNNYSEARFISTRNRPWEIVLWGFYYNEKSPWIMKNVDMLKQQAATIIALGGNINIYNQPKGHRDGRLSRWQMERIAQVRDFIVERKPCCQNTKTVPNAVILHSENDFYSRKSANIWEYNLEHIDGSVFGMLENSIPVDIMDEWALLDKIDELPLVISPQQTNMSNKAVDKLKKYVHNGGSLILTGTDIFDTFGAEFIGADDKGVVEAHTYHLPAADGCFPLSSHGHQGGAWTDVPLVAWRNIIPSTAKGYGRITTTLFEEDKTPYFAFTVNEVGKGKVGYIPCDIMSYYYRSRYPLVRNFIADVVNSLAPDFEIEIDAPTAIEPIYRQKDGKKYIHLINKGTGMVVFENIRGVAEIPPTGPVSIKLNIPSRPNVKLVSGDGKLRINYNISKETATIIIDRVGIHSIIEIKMAELLGGI
jgi:hypothetical protein